MNISSRYIVGLCLMVWANTAYVACAQEGSMTFTVTPPLIQVNLQPGETWSSGIQVVNGNQYDLTVYAEPVLFEPAGENGRPRFKTPPSTNEGMETADATTLAGWIVLPKEALSIPREQTITVPITIQVPLNAAPGGHYAAVLIGNRAPEGVRGESAVSVTSSIASLIFLRVAGTVVEDGRIRDFATEKTIYETPEARFSLRFENQGNVHLQPRGDITIYNMFNKKRGMIPINQESDYGNVMPGSVRKFTYTWKADAGVWDIGRYRAEATLGYGGESKNFAQANAVFYVLPLIPIAEILGGIVALIFFVGWALRAYVRRAIAIETRHAVPHGEVYTETTTSHELPLLQEPKIKFTTLMRPIQTSMVDLRSVARTPRSVQSVARTGDERGVALEDGLSLGAFIIRYRIFFFFVLVVSACWLATSALLSDVLTVERPYEVKVLQEEEVIDQ